MRRISLLLVLVLVVAACGDDDAATTAPTTTAPTATNPTTATTAAAGTTTPTTVSTPATTAPTTTGASGPGGSQPDCRDLWPEPLIEQIVGPGFAFLAGSADGTACTFSTIPASVVVSYRVGGASDYETSKGGALLAGLGEEIAGVCDAAFIVDLAGLVTIEALDSSNGRILNTVVSGVDDPAGVAADLLNAVC